MSEKKNSRVGAGLKEIIGTSPEKIDRSAIQGWNPEEVSNLLSKGKPTVGDIETATARIIELENNLLNVEAATKREEYLWMALIFTNRERHFVEMFGEAEGERYIKHFPQYLHEKCGIPKSTSYTEAKFVMYIIEDDMIRYLADEKLFKKVDKQWKELIKKFRILAYKNDEVKKKYRDNPELLAAPLEEIQSEGIPPERAKWYESRALQSVKIRHTRDKQIKLAVKDDDLRETLYRIVRKIVNKNKTEIEKLLDQL
jgi:hypothetical protein